MTPSSGITGIACSIWARELTTLAAKGRITFPVRYFDSLLHNQPQSLGCRLQVMVEQELSHGNQVVLIVGDCHAGMCEMAVRPGVARVRGVNCCETLLGKEKYTQLIAEGAFFLLPEWARRWRKVFTAALGLDEEGVRTLMGEMVKELVFLDTGLAGIPLNDLKAASEYTGLPYRVLPVALDSLSDAIEEAVSQLEVAHGRMEDAGVHFPALSVMALDILKNALDRTERTSDLAAYVTHELRELTGAKTVTLMRSCGEDEAEWTVVSVCPERRLHVAEDAGTQAFAGKVRRESQVVEEREIRPGSAPEMRIGLPLRAGGETVGVLLLLGLPESRATRAIKDTLAMLSVVMALALRNALLLEGQEQTIRRRTQELAASETRLQLALESADEGMWEWEVGAPGLYFSERILAMLELDPGAGMMPFETWQSLLHPDDREKATEKVIEHVSTGTDRHRMEYRMRSAGGRYRWYEASAKVVRRSLDGAPTHLIGTLRDITAQKELEEQLLQSLKMEAVGRLAGGVAHDFNNLLTVINGYSELVLAELSAADPLRASLAEIRKAGESAAALTRQLLAFSRKQVMQPTVLDLNQVVGRMRSMLERLMGEDVSVRFALHTEAAPVHADPHQLEQVVMNLAVNARDAMPGGGQLVIETAVVEREGNPEWLNPEARAGRFAMLSVSDTGAGMDEATRRKIFEPFFTTKAAGKGTGLGLAMVQGIVAQSGGYIEVHSEPGHGTTFNIYLPAPANTMPEAERPAAALSLRGEETILLVEDQPAVRSFTVAALEAYGYAVIPCPNAGEALRACEGSGVRIDLLLTDVVMPEISGRELAARLRTVRPGIKVMFMSGYTNDVIVQHGDLGEGAAFIQKPFSPEALVTKVRAALGPPVVS